MNLTHALELAANGDLDAATGEVQQLIRRSEFDADVLASALHLIHAVQQLYDAGLQDLAWSLLERLEVPKDNPLGAMEVLHVRYRTYQKAEDILRAEGRTREELLFGLLHILAGALRHRYGAEALGMPWEEPQAENEMRFASLRIRAAGMQALEDTISDAMVAWCARRPESTIDDLRRELSGILIAADQ